MAFPASMSAPGPNTVYVPSFDDSANLIISYSRNEKDFMLNQYVQMVTVDKRVAVYLKFNPKDQARVPFAQAQSSQGNFAYVPGQRRSLMDGQDTNTRIGWIPYSLNPFSLKGSIDYHTAEQAAYDVKSQILNDLAFKCMILRTRRVNGLMLDTTQYATNHTGTATVIGGGLWSMGTLNNPYIKQSVQSIRNQILLDTLGKVMPKDMYVLINPNLAKAAADSQEIHTYMAQQANSDKMLDGSHFDMNENWGLPARLYGIKLIVEQTGYTSKLESTNVNNDTITFVQNDTDAFFGARPGSINGQNGGTSYCSVIMLSYKGEEMTPESYDKPEDKLLDFYVTDTSIPILPAPESFYYLSSCQ